MSFKLIADLLRNFMQGIAPDEHVTYDGYVHDGGYIFKQMTSEEFCCPRCGGNASFTCLDAVKGGSYLSCSADECIKANASTTIKPYVAPSLSAIGVPDMFAGATIAQIRQSDAITQALRDFSTKSLQMLLLAGKPGRGKTYAACAVLQSLLDRGYHGRYISYPDMQQRYNFSALNGGINSLLEMLQEIPVLLIDDFGVRPPADKFGDFIFLLIDKRINTNNRKTIITTNLSSKLIDDQFGSAMVSRLISGTCLKFEEEDRRRINF